jgi:hypothetical protein
MVMAELEKRTNKSGEKLFFICYDTQFCHVVPCIAENGVVKSGGLLDNYFVGRRLSEQDEYVRQRHGKKMTEVKFREVNLMVGHVDFVIDLDGTEFIFKSDFKITVDQKDYFYIEFQNKKITPFSGTRGANEYQRCMATYAAGYLYKTKYAPEKHINIR